MQDDLRCVKKSKKSAKKCEKCAPKAKKVPTRALGEIHQPRVQVNPALSLPQTPSLYNIDNKTPSASKRFPSSTDPLVSGVWELCFPSPFFPLPAQAENLGHA